MSDRPFRRPESYEAEDATRRMLSGFLEERGFSVKSDMLERQGADDHRCRPRRRPAHDAGPAMLAS